MTPTDFPEANSHYGPPPGLEESQVKTIRAFHGVIERGPLEGTPITIVAWMPTINEVKAIEDGKPIFVGFLGGLPPHLMTMEFAKAYLPGV